MWTMAVQVIYQVTQTTQTQNCPYQSFNQIVPDKTIAIQKHMNKYSHLISDWNKIVTYLGVQLRVKNIDDYNHGTAYILMITTIVMAYKSIYIIPYLAT